MLGLRFNVEIFPHKRSLFAANAGWVDGELHRVGGIEQDYPDLVRVPVPINHYRFVALARDPCLRIQRWEDLESYRIGFVRGTISLERRTRGMRVTLVTEMDDLIRSLQAGRIDVVLTARIVAMERLAQLPGTELFLLELPLEGVPVFHYLNRRHAALVPRLQQALEQMRAAGRIAALEREAEAALGYRAPRVDCPARRDPKPRPRVPA
ncbi:MAG: hypothetical protein K0S46_1764 [Moraxellaceae bacterium]|nr:hypothetical protein [Moraxellaceae bacterium]